jgi:ornithine cyclodeaminase/alanine dehydrogenase-like protein (mu-crystallin family)
VTQLHALSRVFQLERVLIYDTDPAATASFAERASFIPITIEAVSLDTLEANSDIICTATTVEVGQGPVIQGNNLKPGIHINAVGSDLPGKTELPLHLLQRSLVCPDFPEQALREGECQQLAQGAPLGPSFFDLVKNQSDYRKFQGQSTVFDSTGFALEDLVVFRLLHRHALAMGLGQRIELEATPSDPKNPYSCLAPCTLARALN